MKAMDTLDDFLLEEVRDMYHAEGQLFRAIPKLARSATSYQLRHRLGRNRDETQRNRERLEQIFAIMGQPARGTRCEAMTGLLKEGDELLLASGNPAVKDTAIICLARKIVHYKIASYGCLSIFARLLGLVAVEQVLADALKGAKDGHFVLTEFAPSEGAAPEFTPAAAEAEAQTDSQVRVTVH